MSNSNMSRRAFVKGSMGAAALGALPLMGCAATQDLSGTGSATTNLPESWDYEVDVVVVGSGSILPAALRAHDSGLETLIIEKHPTHFGGTTCLGGGGCSCPNSTQALDAGAPEIPCDLLKQYMEETAAGQSDEAIIEAYLDNYAPAIDYLADDCGFPVTWMNVGNAPYALYTPLSVLEEEYGGVCGHVSIEPYEDGRLMGRAWYGYFQDAIDERGIQVLMGTAGKKLIYNGNPQLGDGEVVGIYAETADGTIAIKARYAVILGTGGFDHNQEMMAAYIPNPMYGTAVVETNTGDGHIMAMEVGAAMRNMKECYRKAFTPIADQMDYQVAVVDGDTCMAPIASEELTGRMMSTVGCTGSIVVNRYGERFVNESTSYDNFGMGFEQFDTGRNEWRNVPAFLVFDGTYAGTLGHGMPTLQKLAEQGDPIPDYVAQYDSLDALAEGEGIDKDNFMYTVSRYNGFCETGVDLDWNRGVSSWDVNTCGNRARVESGELKNPCLAPLVEGPFYCMKLYPGLMSTKGGMVINENAQVVNVTGNPIPRLYAGSNCIANPLGHGYGWGGGTYANGFIPGFIAANHIATLEPWEAKAE